MVEKFTIDMLNENSVSIKTERFIEIDGVMTRVGDSIRNAYMNTVRDREQLKNLLPEKYYDAIISVWVDTPIDSNSENDANESIEIPENIVDSGISVEQEQ